MITRDVSGEQKQRKICTKLSDCHAHVRAQNSGFAWLLWTWWSVSGGNESNLVPNQASQKNKTSCSWNLELGIAIAACHALRPKTIEFQSFALCARILDGVACCCCCGGQIIIVYMTFRAKVTTNGGHGMPWWGKKVLASRHEKWSSLQQQMGIGRIFFCFLSPGTRIYYITWKIYAPASCRPWLNKIRATATLRLCNERDPSSHGSTGLDLISAFSLAVDGRYAFFNKSGA